MGIIIYITMGCQVFRCFRQDKHANPCVFHDVLVSQSTAPAFASIAICPLTGKLKIAILFAAVAFFQENDGLYG